MTLNNNQIEEITYSPIHVADYNGRYVRKHYGFQHITVSFGGRRKLYLTAKNINNAVNKMISQNLIKKTDLRINKIDWELSNKIFRFMAQEKGFIQ
jgi:hypothetical protein